MYCCYRIILSRSIKKQSSEILCPRLTNDKDIVLVAPGDTVRYLAVGTIVNISCQDNKDITVEYVSILCHSEVVTSVLKNWAVVVTIQCCVCGVWVCVGVCVGDRYAQRMLNSVLAIIVCSIGKLLAKIILHKLSLLMMTLASPLFLSTWFPSISVAVTKRSKGKGRVSLSSSTIVTMAPVEELIKKL